MRIVSGKWRGHNLVVPDTPDTRPTMDKTRQAVFNILRSAAWALKANGEPILNEALVLDVFAGSGAMGFEGVSQGASDVVFFEKAPLAVTAIKKNAEKLKIKPRIVTADVTASLRENAPRTADLAFFDPPYQNGLMMPAIQQLMAQGWISAETLLVLEFHKTETPDATALDILDTRRYGVSQICFARLKA